MSKYKGTSGTEQDIIRAIGYITDARYIASYYGVDVKRVIALRDKIKKNKPAATTIGPTGEVVKVEPKVSSISWNNDAERRSNADAKAGSAALLKALLKFFENRERRLREEQSNG